MIASSAQHLGSSRRVAGDGGSPRRDRARLASRARTVRAAALLLAALAGLALVAGLSACGGSSTSDEGSAELARVNGSPVTQAQVDDVQAEARLAGDEKDADIALDEAIGRALVRQQAERLGLVVEEAEVEERLAAVAERAGGEDALAQALEDAEMSTEQLSRGAEHGLLREKVRDERFGDLAASDAAVHAFYRKHLDDVFTEPAAADLSSLLVRTERLAVKLVKDMRAGKHFDELAKIYGRDPETKENGGRQGWVSLSSLPESLRRAVDEMEKGEIAAPVEGPGGWFILKLHDRRAAEVATFAEVEDELGAELDMRKRSRALDRWIVAERKRAEVVLTTP